MKTPSRSPLDADWLALLRLRFLEIARRRVPEDVVEDLAQDALQVVLEKGPQKARAEGSDHPPLKWCFVVLRNVIGNWYQKRRDHDDAHGLEMTDPRANALDALTEDERRRRIHGALDRLREHSAECADWLWKLACGVRPVEISRQTGIETAALYRRLYRCRKHLEKLIVEEGLVP